MLRNLFLSLLLSSLMGAAAAGSQELHIDEIPPASTDPAIDDFLEPHVVYRSIGGGDRGRVFLFMPGSFGRPANTQLILEEAARAGYHAIGLRYPNRWTVARLCRDSFDPRCFDNVRSEILDGTNRSPRVDVSRANSIENRLERLLEYLDGEFPAEGWEQFLTSGGVGNSAVIWNRVVAGGHSQGGGHAAILGRDRLLGGVLMFGAPADVSRRFGRSALWLGDSHQTPGDRYYAFSHQDDNPANQRAAWRALGLDTFGEPVLIDLSRPPYQRSHMLRTEAEPALPGREHGSVAVDEAIPRNAQGEPLHAPVWRYLLESLGQSSSVSLLRERFEVSASWRRSDGTAGTGVGIALTTDSGYFWFFRPENVELVLKVLDGCSTNGHFWVLAGGLTNVGVEISVVDLETGVQILYRTPLGSPFQPIQDTSAFATCG